MQRKVGFEFETSDLILMGPSGSMELHKPVVTGTGWGMYMDMAPELAGKHPCAGHVEFVLDAVEEDPTGFSQLTTAFGEIREFTNKMLTTWSGWKVLSKQQVPVHELLTGAVTWAPEVAARDKRNDIVVEIRNKKPTAAPQMTAGIKLGQTIAVHQHFGRYKTGADFVGKGDPSLKPATQDFYRLSSLIATKHALALDESNWGNQQYLEYGSALAHLATVIVLGQLRDGIEREKYVGELLSRTNLGKLPEFIRRHPDLKRDVLATAGELATTITRGRMGAPAEGDRLFASGKVDAITVGRWIDAIIAGRDPLTWGQEKPERWAPQEVGQPGNRGWGTVFEFRGMAEGLPIADWMAFAYEGHTWVAGINHSIDTSRGVPSGGVDYGPDYR